VERIEQQGVSREKLCVEERKCPKFWSADHLNILDVFFSSSDLLFPDGMGIFQDDNAWMTKPDSSGSNCDRVVQGALDYITLSPTTEPRP